MKSIYQFTKEQPFHISVGAVLVNQRGEIATLKHPRESVPNHWQSLFRKHEFVYTLMRESLEEQEDLVVAVRRGLQEEFGARAQIVGYVGSLQTRVHDIVTFQKTTLYFWAKCLEIEHDNRTGDDRESELEIVWWEPNQLITQMKSQADIVGVDLDESKIITNYLSMQT